MIESKAFLCWTCDCVHCTVHLAPATAEPGTTFPPWVRARGRPADIRGRVQCSTVQYSGVLYCTLHYCTVLSDCPLCPDTDSLPRSLRAEARTGSDIREEGELPGPGPVIRGQLRPRDSPSLFPLWSKLPQLSLTASLGSKTDRWGTEVICKTIKIRLVLYILGLRQYHIY